MFVLSTLRLCRGGSRPIAMALNRSLERGHYIEVAKRPAVGHTARMPAITHNRLGDLHVRYDSLPRRCNPVHVLGKAEGRIKLANQFKRAAAVQTRTNQELRVRFVHDLPPAVAADGVLALEHA